MVADLHVRVPAEVRRLAEVRHMMRGWLADVGADRTDDVVLAVDEAVANAIEHGAGPERFIGVQATADARSICVEVTDPGPWRLNPVDQSRRRGLAIIRAVMDRVQVDASGRGTRVLMERRRSVGD